MFRRWIIRFGLVLICHSSFGNEKSDFGYLADNPNEFDENWLNIKTEQKIPNWAPRINGVHVSTIKACVDYVRTKEPDIYSRSLNDLAAFDVLIIDGKKNILLAFEAKKVQLGAALFCIVGSDPPYQVKRFGHLN